MNSPSSKTRKPRFVAANFSPIYSANPEDAKRCTERIQARLRERVAAWGPSPTFRRHAESVLGAHAARFWGWDE